MQDDIMSELNFWLSNSIAYINIFAGKEPTLPITYTHGL